MKQNQVQQKRNPPLGRMGGTLRELDVKPCFLCDRRPLALSAWYWQCCPLRCSISPRWASCSPSPQRSLLALLVWITWIRKQYAFGGGGMMEQVHKTVLAHLNFDGQGQPLRGGLRLRGP